MKLQTQCYLPVESCEPVDPLIGLPDLRKGLNTVLLGYLLALGAVLAAAGVIAYVIIEASGAAMSPKVMEQASTVLFAVVLLFGLAMLGSVILIVRGKWMCLVSAPEQFHAKWMMFVSILCLLAGPVLNRGVHLVGESNQAKLRSRASNTSSVARLQQELEAYKEGLPELDTRTIVKLTGQAIGMLSGIFFILFLRAVALGLGISVLARFNELYLLFVGVLVYGVVEFIRHPNYMLARPQLLLGLGAGWLVAGLWYFVLVVSTSIGITIVLARRSRPRNPVPTAPIGSTLPPLPEMAIRK